MSGGSVVFDHVWKRFRRGERHDSLRDLIPSLVRRVLKPAQADELREQEFWAVKDVSFEVQSGQALGIIGPNGAGKSTTLKLLTKILKPTQGHCQVNGRTGALIEVAAGFHPDLTGRENVFLQGAILGMRRAEVLKHFDAIVEFAGVGDFIDTPVKRYSSGMNARLGFAIAVNLDPEVLIIDEVLSVGDMAFQQRCIEHMRGFKKSGVAIVFVSHNLQAISDLCDRAVHLNHGVVCAGPTAEVIDSYVRNRRDAAASSTSTDAAIRSVIVLDAGGQPVESVETGAELVVRVEYEVLTSVTDVTFSMGLWRSTDGLLVYAAQFTQEELGLPGPSSDAGERIAVRVDYHLRASIARGQYYFGFGVVINATQQVLARMSPAATLTVHEYRTNWSSIADLNVRPVTHAPLQAAVGQRL